MDTSQVRVFFVWAAVCLGQGSQVLVAQAPAPAPHARTGSTVRIGATQPRSRVVNHRLKEPSEVLARVDDWLGELEQLVQKAGGAGCDALAFPEDTLGLGTWEAANKGILKGVLPEAASRMLERLGRAAAVHRMYLVCASDTVDADGAVRNTAFFLGRDGKEIGRYHKVNMPIHELDKKRGDGFPVFKTRDLGDVGLLICYDMVFPEAPRCLALAGADIIFHPTLGGAAIGDEELSRAAFRTRAVENFVYLVVSQRGGGSMVISPQGKVLAEGKSSGDIVIADVDPFGGREGGDAMNHEADMRARLFRERLPTAYGILTEPRPPVLEKVPETITVEEAVRIAANTLTAGEDRFKEAQELLVQGKVAEAARAFETLRTEFPRTWIDRVSRERLTAIGAGAPETGEGLASLYPGGEGLERDPRVLFAEGFETGSVEEIAARWGHVTRAEDMDLSEDVHPGSAGRRSLRISKNGHLYTHTRGVDRMHARFYVKFHPRTGYIHHFVHLIADRTPTPWPKGGAGKRPAGDQGFTSGIEPWGKWGKVPPPGVWHFYSYWHEMKPDGRGDYWGNFFDAPQEPIQPGRWYCVEAMLKANSTPGAADGEQAFWVNGKLIGEFKGIRWRTSADLKLNTFWLLYYVTEQSAQHNRDTDPNRVYQVWFDDIVLATEYIGPFRAKPESAKTKKHR